MRLFYCILAIFLTATSSLFAQSYPAIFSIKTNSPVCEGQAFQINAVYSVPPSGTTVGFHWVGPNGFTSNAYGGIAVPASSTTAGIYSVTMTFAGTNQGVVTASTTVSLGGPSKPMALVKDGQYNSPSQVICGPTSLSLLAYPDELYSNNSASYRWTGPNNFVSIEQNPVVNQGVAGLYILEATYPNNCGVGKDTVQIYNATITIGSYAVGSTQYTSTFCQGTSAELRASASVMSGTTASYQWKGPNGFISGGQSLTLTDVSTVMTGTYSVTASFSGACSGSVVSSQYITISEPLVWFGSFQLNSDGTRSSTQSICQGSNFVVDALYMGPNSSTVTFRWKGPNGFVSNTQSNTLTNASPMMSGSYSVTAITPDGCRGVGGGGVTIGLPTVSIASGTLDSNPLNNYSVFCTGSSFRIGASTNGLSSTYRWTGPNGFTSSAQSLTFTNADAALTGTYSVTATFSGVCAGTATASTQIQVGKPIVSFFSQTPGGTTIGNGYCPGMSFYLIPVFSNPPTGFPSNRSTITYQWSGPNGFTSSVKQPTIPTASTLATGVYNLTVTITGECSGSSIVTQTITVGRPKSYVSSLPLTGISMVKDTYCPGATVFIQANNTPSNAIASYRWKGPNGFTSSAQSLTLMNVNSAMAGVYSLTTTYEGQCAGTRVDFANVIVNSSKISIGVFRANGGGGGTPPLCVGNYYVLKPNASSYYSNDVLTQNAYEWTLPDGTISTTSTLTIASAGLANAGRYILKTTFGGVCEAATVRDTADIILGIAPPKVWASNAFISIGRSTTLYAEKCTGSAIQWSNGQTGSSIIVSPTQTTTYTAVCVGYEGCLSPASNPLTIRVSNQPEADLSLRLTTNNRVPALGQPVTVTLSVSNSSDQDANNVRIESRLPDILSVVDVGDMQITGTILTATIGYIPANSSVSVTYRVAFLSAGTAWLSAQIMASDNPDPDSCPASGTNDGQDDTGWLDIRTSTFGGSVSSSPEPNPAYWPIPQTNDVTLPDELIDLSLNAFIDKPAPALGEVVTITLKVSNYANRRLLSPEVTCQLPTGLSFVSSTNMIAVGQQVTLTGGQYYRMWPQSFSFQARVMGAINEPVKARISYCDWDDIDSDPTNGFDTGEDDTAQVNLRVR